MQVLCLKELTGITKTGGQSDANSKGYHGRPSKAHKWQRKTYDRHDTHHHRHIYKGMPEKNRHDSDGKNRIKKAQDRSREPNKPHHQHKIERDKNK